MGSGVDADISSSSVVAGTVSGTDYVGGLVGWGRYADISSSSVVTGTVSGMTYVGGLVGYGEDADISSSSVVAGTVSGEEVMLEVWLVLWPSDDNKLILGLWSYQWYTRE